MCSHSLKMPSDKSHKADHKRGRSHFVHKSFLIFTSDVQSVLSRPRCAACHTSACHQRGRANTVKEMLNFPALIHHLLFVLLFIKLNICVFLCLFIER